MHRMVVAKLRAEWLRHCGVQFSAGIAQEKLSNEKAMDGMAQHWQGIAAKSLGIALDRKAGKWKCTELSSHVLATRGHATLGQSVARQGNGMARLSTDLTCRGIDWQSGAKALNRDAPAQYSTAADMSSVAWA